jgi:hypothetical protein
LNTFARMTNDQLDRERARALVEIDDHVDRHMYVALIDYVRKV